MSTAHKTLRTRFAHQLEYQALRVAIAAMAIVPVRRHEAVARAVARALAIFPWRRDTLDENLTTALGEIDPRRRRELTIDILANSVRLGLELAWMSRIEPASIIPTVKVDDVSRERLERCSAAGRGVLMACGHLGDWEWLAAWYAQTVGQVGVVYKPMHNPWTDRFITGLRARYGLVGFSTREPSQRALVSFLKRGGVVGILSDQDARKRGRFVPFFGRPASTATGMATLAIRLGIPIVPCFCVREGHHIRAVVAEPLWPDPNADREAEELRLLRGYHEALEQAIMQDPAQYFWWHRRWKTKPRPTA